MKEPIPISAIFKPLTIFVFGKIIAIIGISTFAANGLKTTLNGNTSYNVTLITFCGISVNVFEHFILHMYIRAAQIT